jgi:zinc protease
MQRSNALASCRRVATLLVLLLCSFALPAAAETNATRQGRLANGLTYFIDPAKAGDGKISFTLIVKVGEYQTLPHEQSTAHVLEHIIHTSAHVADRKGSLRARLASFGGVWGEDSNAATQSDYTTYFVKLPASDSAALAAGLDILTDWMAPRDLSDDEIEREIKAVIEEARQGASDLSIERLEAQLRTWFPGEPLYDFRRDGIGHLSATPAGIRALHKQWYTPPNMAIVIRGGVDPDAVLAQLESRYANIPRGEPSPAATAPGALPLTGGNYVLLASRGASESKVRFTYKYRVAPFGSEDRAKDFAVTMIVDKAAQAALGGLAERYDAPISGIGLDSERGYYPGVDILTLTGAMAPGREREALGELVRVAATLGGEGLAEADIERARKETIAAFADRPANAADRFQRFFISGHYDPLPEAVRSAAERITVAEVNAWLGHRLDRTNRDIFLSYPLSASASVPDAAAFDALARTAEQAPPLKLARSDIRNPVFIAFIPAAVRAKAPTPEGQDFVRWRLPRSGATLLYRRIETTQVKIAMLRRGGLSRVSPEHRFFAAMIGPVVSGSGLAGLDIFELGRFNASHGVSLAPLVKGRREGLEASAPKEELPLLLDLVRAQLLQPLCRGEAFEAVKRALTAPDNADADAIAGREFDTMVQRALGNPFLLDRDRLGAVKAADVCRDYLSMTGDTSDMVIAVEGDDDPARIYRAVAAALDLPPTTTKTSAPEPAPPVAMRAGRDVLRAGDGKLANVVLMMQWEAGDKDLAGQLVASIMSERLTARLRSVEKATYWAMAGFSAEPNSGAARFFLSFDTAPEQVDRLILAAKQEIEKLRRDGITARELASARALVPKHAAMAPLDVTEVWLSRRTLAPQPQASHAEVAAWIKRRIDVSRLREFVRLPQT